MPLSLEHSALIIAANVPELEHHFRYLAEEISLVASYLADTEPKLSQLTKLRDEIEFAAENLKERSESVEVQAAAADLYSDCKELYEVLFHFRRHHNGNLSAMDQPHELGRDLINDLREEIGEDWDFIVQKTQQPIDEVFERMKCSSARIKSAAPNKLAPLYELDEFFRTAALTVTSLDSKERYDKVQQEIIPKYRALFEKCCDTYPCLTQHFAESFDDEQLSSEMIKHRQAVRNALKDNKIDQKPEEGFQASNDNALITQRHPYAGTKLPGHPSGWHKLVKDHVTLYGRRLKLQNKPARLLMRFLLAGKRLSIQDLSCVDDSWQDNIDSDDDDISKSADNSIRVALTRLRIALRTQLRIPEERQKEIIKESDMKPTVWELNWKLLDEYGLEKANAVENSENIDPTNS